MGSLLNRDWIDFVALGIAIIALVQPWVVYVFRKIRGKPVLECFANKSATLNFDTYGVGLNCTLTMISKKSDNVITDVELNIFRGDAKDSKIYHMNWELLSSIYKRSTYSEWISSRETTSFAPCPMYLTKGNPVSYGIYFGDERISKKIQETMQSEKGTDYIRDTLLTQFNFQEGDYRVEIVFTDIKERKKLFTYKFKLSTIDVDRMKYNAAIICDNLMTVEKKPTNIVDIKLVKDRNNICTQTPKNPV